MTNYELINLIINGVGATFVGTSILLLIKQLKKMVLSHADNHEWNRRIETQQALDKMSGIGTDKLNKYFNYAHSDAPIELDKILMAFEEDHELQLCVNSLLNFYERLANGVFLGTYDELTIKANIKGPMERNLVRFKYYIGYTKAQGRRTVWSAYERLIEKWDNELKKNNDRSLTGHI